MRITRSGWGTERKAVIDKCIQKSLNARQISAETSRPVVETHF